MTSPKPTIRPLGALEDAEAVAAVKGGDDERYRELVERHQRHVFAVAWSRLGDTALAEEAAQEAFIRGYRRLGLLGDGQKFAGWIASIARHAAINLGIRHRRELNKRERWALESPSAVLPEEASEPCTPEMLRETLRQLPAAHRECLTLFYLEGKSGAEAAAALGISESAFRQRLHRARSALRHELEIKLSDSLEKLRPSPKLVPSIMAAIPASSGAKAVAAGTGASLAGTLAKFAPLKGFFPFFSFVTLLPTLLLSWFFTKLELTNFRDPEGFRARLFKEGLFWRIAGVALLMLCIGSFVPLIRQEYFRTPFLVIGLISLLTGALMARQLVINRNRFFISNIALSFTLATASFAVGFRLMPVSLIYAVILVQVVLTARSFPDRPIRMDYNLFLRAVEGLLPPPLIEENPAMNPRRAELLAFARFLGTRWLAVAYRWTEEGLILRLAPVRWSRWGLFEFLRPWARRSRIVLKWNGDISARICATDRIILERLGKRAFDSNEIEARVSSSAQVAWAHFRNDDFTAAERALGQAPEDDVFVMPPSRSKTTRWYRKSAFAIVLLVLSGVGLQRCKQPWMEGLKPVALTETEVRAALANYTATHEGTNASALRQQFLYALFSNFLLPPTNLFTAETLRAVRADTLKFSVFASGGDLQAKYASLALAGTLEKAMVAGWFNFADLGLSAEEITDYLRQKHNFLSRGHWEFILQRRLCRDGAREFSVERVGGLNLTQLRWLGALRCLDLVSREKLIAQARSLQVLSSDTAPDQPPIRNWRDVRGLFVTPGWPVLHDTYYYLSMLELLGALDQIDREACIQAILHLHRGKGYFSPPETDEPWRLQIRGDAADTFCAFESLRILGALDRVKDLRDWKFRLRHLSKAPRPAVDLTWDEVQAWLCQQRLNRFFQ